MARSGVDVRQPLMGTSVELDVESPTSTRRRPVVLVLTEDSKPALGGIAEMLHRLAGALAGRYVVRVVSSVEGASSVAGEAVSYEEVSWFRARSRLPGDGNPLLRRLNSVAWHATRGARGRRQLRGLLVRHRPEWVILFRLSAVTQPWVSAMRRLGVPYDVVAYGRELLERGSDADRRRRTRALREARRVFAISGATAALVREHGVRDDRITLVHPGIDPEALVAPRDARARAAAVPGTSGRYLLSICTLVPRKGIDLAIRAFAEIARAHEDLQYVIAGKGDARSSLAELARELGVADRVHLAGPVDDETRLALFDGCEFFVMPNRRLAEDVEGFGIVFLEANMFGKAVIGGANGGVVDAVEHEVSGLLVDTSVDHAELASAMRRLLDEPELSRRLGDAGRRRAAAEFTWQRAAERFHCAHVADLAGESGVAS